MDERENLRWVVLDFDGTLVDLKVDWSRVRRRIESYFAAQGIPASLRPLVQGVEDALKGVENPQRARSEVHRILSQEEMAGLDGSTEIEGAKELVQGLAAKRYRLAIYSGNDQNVIARGLSQHGFQVGEIIGRQVDSFTKPDERALSQLTTVVPKDQIRAVIGNGWADEKVAADLGKPFFLVNPETFAQQVGEILRRL